ncbi:hypothetical protein CHX27_08755 [Flavobacterium aurantiibacter]|uniref:Uncharacterized protein n=2 Tax=Flavobacterium aurantiibacter TaxID=2023067 RepID=A0A255ZT12_9FLAO|nr:hypothetical protein CHX27_08755 [Flavobacterium aurantiibacter]
MCFGYSYTIQILNSRKPKIERVGSFKILEMMKTITLHLFVALTLGTLTTATAFNDFPCAVENAEPFVFTERGIDFYVFPDGQFDFNTRPETTGDYYYRKAGTRAQARGRNQVEVNYGVRIEHDAFGRVRRVGNVFINYDAFDRVNRIGTVYMRYNRFAMSQISGLRIEYDRRGNIVNFVGDIRRRTYYNGYDYGYNTHEYQDDTYYYYRADGTRGKMNTKN